MGRNGTIEDPLNCGHVEIYSDGSARGNPGPGGYGTIVRYTDPAGKIIEKEFCGGFEKTTNNRMELLGAIIGFEALKRPCSIDFYSDSQYVVKAFNDNWIEGWVKRGWKNSKGQPVANTDLWKRMLSTIEGHDVSYHWVKGHAGHPENERCDELATSAADGTNLSEDTGFHYKS